MQESDSSEWNRSMTDRSKKKKKFECGCGKVYNSAASLSTHVKLQHDGVTLEAQKKQDKPPRGRPKQYQYKQLKQPDTEATNPLLQLRPMLQARDSCCINAKQIYESEAIFSLIKRYMEQNESGSQLRFIAEDKIYEATMGRGVAILIKELESVVEQQTFFHELVLLMTIYIAHVIEETQDQNVLNNGSVGLLPEFANVFILYDLAQRCERLKLNGTWLSDRSKVIKTLSILFRWLNYKQFTHTTAIVNEEKGAGDKDIVE